MERNLFFMVQTTKYGGIDLYKKKKTAKTLEGNIKPLNPNHIKIYKAKIIFSFIKHKIYKGSPLYIRKFI